MIKADRKPRLPPPDWSCDRKLRVEQVNTSSLTLSALLSISVLQRCAAGSPQHIEVRPPTDVHRCHQELCEAGGRHGKADPGPEPQRGRSVPAAQPGHQEEEEALFKEAQLCLHTIFPQRHPGRREGDQSRSGD